MRIKTASRTEANWSRIAVAAAFLMAFWAMAFWPSSQPAKDLRAPQTNKLQVDNAMMLSLTTMTPAVAKWAELTDLGRKIPRQPLVGRQVEEAGDGAEGIQPLQKDTVEVEEGAAAATDSGGAAWGDRDDSGSSRESSSSSSGSSSGSSRDSGSRENSILNEGFSEALSLGQASLKRAAGDDRSGAGEGVAQPSQEQSSLSKGEEGLSEGPGGEAPDKQEAAAQPAESGSGSDSSSSGDGSSSSGSSSDGGGGIASQLVEAPRCPPLTKELLQEHAKNNTVMLGVMNKEQQDFGRNWLHHVRALKLGYFVVGATDANTSALLTALKVPCFDFSGESKSLLKMDSDPDKSYDWGAEGWRRMTWHKVFVLDKVADWGFNIVMSDMDVTWLRDPLPLFAKHPQAEVIFSADGVGTDNGPGDEGLDVAKNMWENFNTGVYLLRHTPNTTAWAHAWRALFESGFKDHDQHGAYEITRKGNVGEHPEDSRVRSAFDGKLWLGVMPPTLFSNAHSYYVQRLHEVKEVKPYEVHYTWTYNGRGGKVARARDAMLWRDEPGYYSQGNFVTVELKLNKVPDGYNDWTENEQMITYHLSQLQAQLFQAYIGMALAVASNRSFISPKFQCYCDKIWYAVNRCRMIDGQGLQFPFSCPTDYIFKPDQFRDINYGDLSEFGTPLDFRENSFLDNPATPAAVKNSVLIIEPSSSLSCKDCVEYKEEGAKKVLLVPPSLKDKELLPLLKPYTKFRVWKLSLTGVSLPAQAFGGFACAGAARMFDARMAHITGDWCCRYEEEAKGYGKENEIVVPYRMGRVYSQQKELDESC